MALKLNVSANPSQSPSSPTLARLEPIFRVASRLAIIATLIWLAVAIAAPAFGLLTQQNPARPPAPAPPASGTRYMEGSLTRRPVGSGPVSNPRGLPIGSTALPPGPWRIAGMPFQLSTRGVDAADLEASLAAQGTVASHQVVPSILLSALARMGAQRSQSGSAIRYDVRQPGLRICVHLRAAAQQTDTEQTDQAAYGILRSVTAVTAAADARAFLVEAHAAYPRGGDRWTLCTATPATDSRRGPTSPGPAFSVRLLPLPAGAETHGVRLDDRGRPLCQLASVAGSPRLLMEHWVEAGWRIGHPVGSRLEDRAFVCRKGARQVQVRMLSASDPSRHFLLIWNLTAASGS